MIKLKNIAIVEMKRAIINKRFIILIILGIIVHIYSLYVWDGGYIFFDYNATDINIEAAKTVVATGINRYTFWYHSMDVYTVIMPLLACLPYSTSFMEDKKSSFINYIATRTKKQIT